jgi:PIN domain nuclease of toxin-antitoxin system
LPATRGHGLSLGDRACLALARTLGATALTTDRAWRAVDVGVAIEVIR